MKKILLVGAIVILVGGAAWFHKSAKEATKIIVPVTDFKNASYEIEGEKITLVNGIAETSTEPDGASTVETRYFGNSVVGDFDKDGTEDTAIILSQETGGTGTFYYVAVALAKNGTYRGTNGVFLGDRIAPQTTEWRNGEIIVNFAERKATDPMTAQPSVAVSKYFKILEGKLVPSR